MIYLHIGRHKTGTTSIQKYFHQHKNFFQKKNLVYFPTKDKSFAHHHYPYFLKEQRFSRDSRLLLSKEICKITKENDKDFLISSEDFQNIYPSNIKDIFNLTNHEITILIYLRDPVKYFISSWKQYIHANYEVFSFKKYINTKKELCMYITFINQWRRFFENVVVRNFEKDALINNNLIHDFASIVSPNTESTDLPDLDYFSNKSLDNVTTLFKLNINNFVNKRKISIIRPGLLYNKMPDLFDQSKNFRDIQPFYLNEKSISLMKFFSREAYKLESEIKRCKFEFNYIKTMENFSVDESLAVLFLEKINYLEEINLLKKESKITKEAIYDFSNKFLQKIYNS